MDTIFFKDILQFQFEDYIISVNDFRLQTLTKSYPAHYHSHNSLEIHFYESGTGKMIIDDTQYDINPMSLFVTGPFVNHEQIVYTPLLKYSLYLTMNKIGNSNNYLYSLTKIKNIAISNKKNILELFKSIMYEFQNKKIGFEINSECLLKLLIIEILRNKNSDKIMTKELKVDNINYTIEEIFLNDFKTITITKLATKLYTSPRQLQRMLKAKYNKTFSQLKLEAKMNFAKNQLLNSNIKISEISTLCGYSSTEHFCQHFKKYFNITPLKFRKAYQKY